MEVTLLEQGLAKLQTPYNADKITNFHQFAHAEQSAKMQKLKIWKNRKSSYTEEELDIFVARHLIISRDLCNRRRPTEWLSSLQVCCFYFVKLSSTVNDCFN